MLATSSIIINNMTSGGRVPPLNTKILFWCTISSPIIPTIMHIIIPVVFNTPWKEYWVQRMYVCTCICTCVHVCVYIRKKELRRIIAKVLNFDRDYDSRKRTEALISFLYLEIYAFLQSHNVRNRCSPAGLFPFPKPVAPSMPIAGKMPNHYRSIIRCCDNLEQYDR